MLTQGFFEICEKGIISGHPLTNCRFVLEDGMHHLVDSSELAFKLATQYAVREVFPKLSPYILEPVMTVNVNAPTEYQGSVTALLNKRKGSIVDSEVKNDYVEFVAEVPLNEMFGFSTDLRSISQGKGEFSMEYLKHARALPMVQQRLVEQYEKKRAAELASKK